MKKFSTEIKRVLSMLLALMLVFSIVAEPGGMLLTRAKSDADTSSTLSTPVYTHAMDALAPESDGNVAYENYYPTGWLYSNRYNNISASTIVSVGTDMYYQMKMGASSTGRDTLAYYAFTAQDGVGSNAVLKYRLMVDNSAVTGDWTVYMPILANKGDGRTLTLKIVPSGTAGVYTLSDGTNTFAWTEGRWYDVELIISNDGKAWALWVDDAQVFSGTKKEAYKVTNQCINMGFVKGENAGVSLNVDDLKVYNYTAGTGFSFAQSDYEVAAGSTVTPVWNVTPANAYIPSVTFSSSNELVAKVDASTGVVTGVAAGTAVITATPDAATGLAAATATVTVTGNQESDEPATPIISESLYANAMDALAPESDGNVAYENYYPTGWLYSNKYNNINASTIVSVGADMYYQMKMGASSTGRDTLAYYAFTAQDGVGSNAVLKYRLMVDNSAVTGNWTVYMPILANKGDGRALTLNIVPSGTAGVYTLSDGTNTFALTEGRWYDVELVISNDGKAWSLWVDDAQVFSGTKKEAYKVTNQCINMGFMKGENAGVSLNVDDLEVYNYAAGATLSAAQDSYELGLGETGMIDWALAPAGAYLPAVTFSSSNDRIATVNPETGMVTGIAAGTVTITATPAASSGIAAAQATVIVAGGGEEEPLNGIFSKPLYYQPMDMLAATNAGCSYAQFYPDNWLWSNKYGNINASSIIADGEVDYYQMKMGASVTDKDTLAYYGFTAEDAVDGNLVLKYRLMVDNGTVTGNWSVYIPILASLSNGRTVSLVLSNTETAGVYKLVCGENVFQWNEGQWYDVEMIVTNDGQAWALWIDGEKIFTGTAKAAYKNTCDFVNMGIPKGQNAGVSLCVDELAVYQYTTGTGVSFEKDAYEVIEGKNVATAWILNPVDAYLPYITYSSSNTAVATVDKDGIITGVSAGTATITATPAPSTGMAPATVTVTVKAAADAVEVTDVVINETNVKVSVGSTTTLTATVNPGNASVKGVTWASDNKAVATVDVNGVVTGIKAGTANITVTTDDGSKTATVAVIVEPVVATGVTINDGVDMAIVTAGKFVTMYAAVTPAGAINKTVKWASSNTSVATVDADTGVVTGVAAGTAVITVTVDGTTITDTITVLVKAAPTEKCANPIYENSMDALNTTGETRYPLGWTRESQTATASGIVTYGGRTYWQMKNSAEGITASAYAVYTFPTALTAAPISVKYSIMVDNGDAKDTIYLPAFTNAKRSRLFTLTIAGGKLTADGGSMNVENGKWYDVEVVLDGAAWRVYVDGGLLSSGTLKEAVTSVAYLNAGIYAKASTGTLAKNICLNIDNLSVHEHTECSYNSFKGISFEKALYRFTDAATFTPALKNLPQGTSVAYASSNEAIATVDASGVVTLTGEVGEAVISAHVDGCTIPAATTVVKRAAKFTYSEDFSNGLNGWRVKIHCADSSYYSLTTKEVAGNKAMALKQIAQSDNSTRATYSFADGVSLERATISYDFMLEDAMGVCYLPGFIKGTTGMVGQLMVGYGNLSRMTKNNWVGTSYWIEPDTWYHLEQVVDTVAGVYDLYINDELILAQEPIADNCVAFNGLYIGMFKVCTNTQYIDNILVTEEIKPVTSISFEQPSYEAVVGGNSTVLSINVAPADRNFRTAKFISSDPTIATVNGFGKVTALKAGTVTITAIPNGNPNLSATTTLTVVEKPVTGISANDISINVHGHQYLNPVIIPSDAGNRGLLYSSSNNAVVTVDEWGEIVAIGKGTAQITIKAEKYPNVTKTITVTVTDAANQGTIFVSVNGGGDGTSKNSPMTLDQAMAKVATMDKTRGNIVVELAAGYYKRTTALNFTAAHGGTNNTFVTYRAETGAEVIIGGAEKLDSEIVSGFTKVDGKNYYAMQLNKDINTRNLIINGVRAVRARSNGGLTDPQLITSASGVSYYGFSCKDDYLLNIPADDQADLEFSYSVEWANHRGHAQTISKGEDGRINIIMEQPNFQSLVAHSNISIKDLVNPSRPYSMFYENALILLDEPGEWYFDNEEMKLYYMPYPWEDVNNLDISYPIIDDWTKDGLTEADSGLVNILGDENGIVQNIKFEGITFADTTYTRTNTNVGMSASQGMHIRDYNSTSADVMPDAAITLSHTNSIYFTGCTFKRLGITGINMLMGTQNVQINGCIFSDISGNGMYIGQTNWRNKAIYSPSNPVDIVKNCDVYNSYIHDIGTEYKSASAIGVGFAAYVNLENNEIYNVDYSPMHIGLGWTAEIKNVLRHLTVRDNFIHDFNQGGVWDSGGIYVNGTTSGNLDLKTGIGSNLISGNYLRNMGVGTAALYNDGGSDNYIWEYNVVDLSESPLWHNAYTPNGAQWLTVGDGNQPCLMRYNYTSHSKTRAGYKTASGASYKLQGPYNEKNLNDNTGTMLFIGNVVCEDLNWPAEARAIMAKSGLAAAYAYLRNNHAERIVTDLPGEDEDTLVFAVGDTFNINLRATDGKDAPVDLSGATIGYHSSDESVVTVSADGVITAVGKGESIVRCYIKANDIVQVVETPVSVGTDLVDIEMDGLQDDGTLQLSITGDPVTLKPLAVTERGIKLTPDSVAYAIADSSIASIDEAGLIAPLKIGETTLSVTVKVKDQSYTKQFALKVIRPINFVLHDLAELFQRTSVSKWKSLYSKFTVEQDKSLKVQLSNTGYTTFLPNKYLNEMFCFEFSMTRESAWPSFVLRGEDSYSYVSAGATGYLVSFTDKGIQLQRFNGRDRTVLYGTVAGFDPVYGGDIPYFLEDGKQYKIQLGALTIGTTVRLYLSVDGQIIFDVKDKEIGAITTSGYFGIVAKKDDVFNFVKAKDLSEYTLPPLEEYTEKGESGKDNVVMDGTLDVDQIPTGETTIVIATNPHGQPTRPTESQPDVTDPINGSGDNGSGAKNGWVLPVVIASILVVAAGALVLVYFILKKRNQTILNEQSDAETE